MSGHGLTTNLNDAQKIAVQTTDGPVLILAGAGSGKTSVLTRRIAYLIAEKQISPFNILAVTFTNKAAGEMKHRIERLVGYHSQKIWIGTFHSIFGKILRNEAEKIGYSKNYTIYDSDDQLNLVKISMEYLGISQELYSPNIIRAKINKAKNTFQNPSQFHKSVDNPMDEKAALVYTDYEKRLRQASAFDFDDLIVKPIELFQQFPETLTFYQEKFHYIHVDEYQDTNRAQYILMKMLAAKYRNLCVVGDDDQSIYGWRHADIGNILNFEKDYPEASVYKLEQNYRSTANILQVANEVVRNNEIRKDKSLWTDKAQGKLITVFECDDDRAEAKNIAQVIQKKIQQEKIRFADFAVLYRTNAQSRVLEDALRQMSIAYVIVGGVRFYDRKEVKDVMAYLKLISNPADVISLQRVINFPARGIGKTTLEKLEEFSQVKNMPLFDAFRNVRSFGAGLIQERTMAAIVSFCEFIQKYQELRTQMGFGEWVRILIDELGLLKMYQQENSVEAISRYENIVELLNAVSEFSMKYDAEQAEEPVLEAFLKEVALVADVDKYDENKNAVTLMTIHSAKGLEFPLVVVAGLEEGLFPLENARNNARELEEERRLFYVSTTRAQNELYLSFAKRRMRFNNIYQTDRSRFIEEVPAKLLDWQKISTYEPRLFEGSGKSWQSKNYSGSERVTAYEDGPSRVKKSLKDFSDEIVTSAAITETKYRIGQQVIHASFGTGTIKNSEGQGDKQKLTILFGDGVERRLMVKYANLMVK